MKLEDYKALQAKPTRAAPKKKVQSAAEQMDISQSDQNKALDCVTINSNAEYAEYDEKGLYHIVKPKGVDKRFKIIAEEIK